MAMPSVGLVPFLDLTAQYATIRDEIREALDRVIESQHFILGPEVEALEREVAEYCGCAYGIGVSSGTDALLASLMAIGVGSGHEVITSPYTFFATAGAIVRVGAKPVFVDIEQPSFNLSADAIEGAITARTRAIIPVHLFGQMADMDAIMRIARAHGLFVIEDAAQAIGAELNGRRAGSFGQLGCFSFYPSKNLGGFGDGGMITTSDSDLASKLKRLRNHGQSPKYHSRIIGGNFRLDEIQAAVLRVKLKHLEMWTEARRRNAAGYRDLFSGTGIAYSPDGDVDSVILPQVLKGRRHIYNQYVIRVHQRDALIAHLKRDGIGTEIYYPLPLHLQDSLKDLIDKSGDFPNSERAAGEAIALPIYPELGSDSLRRIVDSVRQFFS